MPPRPELTACDICAASFTPDQEESDAGGQWRAFPDTASIIGYICGECKDIEPYSLREIAIAEIIADGIEARGSVHEDEVPEMDDATEAQVTKALNILLRLRDLRRKGARARHEMRTPGRRRRLTAR